MKRLRQLRARLHYALMGLAPAPITRAEILAIYEADALEAIAQGIRSHYPKYKPDLSWMLRLAQMDWEAPGP